MMNDIRQQSQRFATSAHEFGFFIALIHRKQTKENC
jgi:hypothetical protein